MSSNNHPWDEVLSYAQVRIAEGGDVYQKYTCSGCGSRLAIEEPNKFYTMGACDRCPALTDVKKDGCNYILVLPGRSEDRRLTIAEFKPS